MNIVPIYTFVYCGTLKSNFGNKKIPKIGDFKGLKSYTFILGQISSWWVF